MRLPGSRSTVFMTATLPLDRTTVDHSTATLFPVNPTVSVATTRGWIQLNR